MIWCFIRYHFDYINTCDNNIWDHPSVWQWARISNNQNLIFFSLSLSLITTQCVVTTILSACSLKLWVLLANRVINFWGSGRWSFLLCWIRSSGVIFHLLSLFFPCFGSYLIFSSHFRSVFRTYTLGMSDSEHSLKVP